MGFQRGSALAIHLCITVTDARHGQRLNLHCRPSCLFSSHPQSCIPCSFLLVLRTRVVSTGHLAVLPSTDNFARLSLLAYSSSPCCGTLHGASWYHWLGPALWPPPLHRGSCAPVGVLNTSCTVVCSAYGPEAVSTDLQLQALCSVTAGEQTCQQHHHETCLSTARRTVFANAGCKQVGYDESRSVNGISDQKPLKSSMARDWRAKTGAWGRALSARVLQAVWIRKKGSEEEHLGQV